MKLDQGWHLTHGGGRRKLTRPKLTGGSINVSERKEAAKMDIDLLLTLLEVCDSCCSHQRDIIFARRQMTTPLSSLSMKFSVVILEVLRILLSQSARSSLRGMRHACCNLIILAAYSSALATASRASLD